MTIEPDTIYLDPSRQNPEISGIMLSLVAPAVGAVPNRPPDAFFRTLAAGGPGTRGVIPSGTGNDGIRGALGIIGGGGKLIVQEPGPAAPRLPGRACGVAADCLTGQSTPTDAAP